MTDLLSEMHRAEHDLGILDDMLAWMDDDWHEKCNKNTEESYDSFRRENCVGD